MLAALWGRMEDDMILSFEVVVRGFGWSSETQSLLIRLPARIWTGESERSARRQPIPGLRAKVVGSHCPDRRWPAS